jgi:hypothetical protein
MTMANGFAPVDPLLMVGQPIVFFDSYANPTKVISNYVPRRAAHLIVEAFPTSPGIATIQVVDANGQAGQLTPCTDSNGLRSSISAYSKFLAKGVMERVAIQLTVQSGAWSVWGTFTDQASDRANYYDRAPLIVTGYYNQSTGPHTETVRASYIVPAGRKAYVEVIYARLLRQTVAGTPGLYSWTVYYNPKGVGPQAIGDILTADNGTSTEYKVQISQLGLMLAGDALDIRSQDLSTGGTVGYLGQLKLAEFDA